jgi:hypothetical protein
MTFMSPASVGDRRQRIGVTAELSVAFGRAPHQPIG